MKVVCPHCKREFEVEDALSHELEEAQLKEIKRQLEKEFEVEKQKIMAKLEGEKQAQLQKLTVQLETQKSAQKQDEERFKAQAHEIEQLLEQTRTLKQERDLAQLEANKKLKEYEINIKKQAMEEAEENFRLQLLEKDKQIKDMDKSLSEAKRTAQLSSQQLQGEVFELDIEALLKTQFLTDEINPIAKGERGADIEQVVKNIAGEKCGTILWEIKNAKWQKGWIEKFMLDIQAKKADIGVLVATNLPNDKDIFFESDNLIVVKRNLVYAIAGVLRRSIENVFMANKNLVNKDQKMQALFQYVSGMEFRNRLQNMAISFKMLKEELDKEKKQTYKRWGRQEKALEQLIGNTDLLYGELQGVTNQSLLPAPEFDDDDED